MSSPSIPSDLLELATFLIGKEPKKPKQSSLPRAVSTAYYALFHLLTQDAAALMTPNVGILIQHRICRWYEHRSMKISCGRFPSPKLEKPLCDRIGPTASPDLQCVAKNFMALQEARHRADYDMGLTLTRTEAEAYL